MATVSLAPDFRSLSRQPPPDPDIQATLSDYLTYTEHYPSHLTRSLTLIGDQRERAEAKIKQVHDASTLWSILPTIKSERHDPVKLRRDISYALEEAVKASRMAVEEAVRMDEMTKREAKGIDTVVERLKAQPMPPSRDPTPEQQALTSPNLKRERRMSTRAEDTKPEKPSRKLNDKAASKLRGRKIMVPGEVLPPPDPNAPVESISDLTSSRASPSAEQMPTLVPEKRTTVTPRPRSRTPKVPKPHHDLKAQKQRGPRAPGMPGTNAHSAVAGISTSNALLALTKPPEDAAKGSKWLPWMKLTEWEMAKLRKRMKKNAIWVPSQTMVRRELRNLGRGKDGREDAKKRSEETGEPFVDEPNEDDPTRVLISGEESAQMTALFGTDNVYVDEGGEDADQELINRGMRLNEAKKLKRQRLLEEQALQAQLAREQGVEAPAGEAKVIIESKDGKKRKRDTTPATSVPIGLVETPDPLSKAGPAPKRLKIAPAPTIKTIPLAPAGPSSSPKSSNRNRRADTPPTRKPTLILKPSKAVSEEPPNRRASLRRSSNASLPSGTLPSPRVNKSGGGRKSRRPAPGILTNDDNESAKVGVSKRKAAPRKKGAAANKPATSSDPVVPESALPPEEYIDPDEPRYCICGDVSWGTMIACDNEESCEKEWFHLACVGLDDLPPRRTKWFCPDCRKRLKQGQNTNGLVGKTANIR